MVLVEGNGLPWGVEIHSANPHELNLVEPLLEKRQLSRKPRRLIYDKAVDCDALRERLKQQGIDLICPHRANRKAPKLQDGRKLRRYRRRYKVERANAWLQNFRRLVTRYERYAHLFTGFVHLACMMIAMRRF